MSAQLPEGVDRDIVLAHGVSVQLVAETINHAADYLRAEEGSPEEGEAEKVLGDSVEVIVGMGEDVVGNVILSFASLLIAVAEPEAVQGWFDEQQTKIREALG